MDRTANAMLTMAEAIKAKNPAAAEAASVELGEGSHDITHDYYGIWLPAGGLQGAETVAAGHGKTQTASAGAQGHGDEAAAQPKVEGPNWLVIGGFLAVMALVVFGAALTKPKSAVGGGSLPDNAGA